MAGLEKAGVELVAENAVNFFGDMSKASIVINQFSSDVTSAAGKTSGAGEIITGALRQVGTLAVNAFMEAGKAIGGFVKDSIGVAGDFEAGMADVSIAIGDALDGTGLKLDNFRNDFIQIGKELPVSTSEVQQAFTELVKGGVDPVALHMGGLKESIQFATAADMDLVAASELSARQLGVWTDASASAEEQAQFLAKSHEILVKTANASTVGVLDLGKGMNVASGQAKALNLDYQDFATGMALIAPAFNSSEEAGTSYKNFLSRLQPTTKPAIEAMQGLGLWTEESGSAFFDATGKYVGNREAAELLRGATENLTDAQRASLLQTIFGNDAMGAAARLATTGADGYDLMADKIEKATGVAAAAEAKQKGFNTALDNFKGSVEALQITIGSVLLPILTTLFNDYLAPGINVLTDLAGALSGDSDAFARLSPTMQAVASTITEVIATVSALIGYVTALNEDGDYLNDWLTHLPEPLQPIVAGFGQIIATFQSTSAESSALGGVLSDLSDIWNLLMEVVAAAGQAYQDIIEAVLPIVSGFIDEHGDEIMDIMGEVWDTIVTIIEAALEIYEAIVPPVLEAIADFISENGDEISAIVEDVWTVIKVTIDTVLTVIQGIIKAALAIIHGDFAGAHRILEEMNERVWNNIKEAISAIWDTIVILLEGVWNDIKGKAEGAWDAIKGTIEGAANGIADILKGLPGMVAGVGEAVMNTIWDGMRAVWDGIVDWLNAKLEWFRSQLPHSEPKDPRSPLRGLRQSGMAIVEMLREGMEMAGPLLTPDLVRPTASPQTLLARGAATQTTYNQQRTTSLNYHTTYAPPASQSLALVNALAGGS